MPSHTLAPFPEELLAAKKQIRERARSYGLDFFPVIYEMCDYEQMNQIAAYGGFPQRYPHWRFGMEYERPRGAPPAAGRGHQVPLQGLSGPLDEPTGRARSRGQEAP